MRFWAGWLAASMLAVASPAIAQAPAPVQTAVAPSLALQTRIDELPAIINGTGDFDAFFAQLFKSQVPKAQFDQIGKQFRSQFGQATKVESVSVATPWDATVKLGFDKGVGTIRIVVDQASPHQVTALLFTTTEPRGDSLAMIESDFRKLPGVAGFGVYSLEEKPVAMAEIAATTTMPIGSAFKLWVLAEAARQVSAGERKWSDIVALGPRSLPSGVTQAWPAGAPATLHTLATLMISISDNSATDTLLTTLGRARIDAVVASAGTADPDATLPILTTMEAFRLKAPANADLAARWKAAGPDGRRRLLVDNAARLTATPIDAGMFGDKPLALDVEWFASPRDQAATLNWLRLEGGKDALAILAVNPGTPQAALFDYAGFKGGSEPGVIYGSWLLKTKTGKWFAVTGGWHRTDAGVETPSFMNIMNRLIAQVATR